MTQRQGGVYYTFFMIPTRDAGIPEIKYWERSEHIHMPYSTEKKCTLLWIAPKNNEPLFSFHVRCIGRSSPQDFQSRHHANSSLSLFPPPPPLVILSPIHQIKIRTSQIMIHDTACARLVNSTTSTALPSLRLPHRVQHINICDCTRCGDVNVLQASRLRLRLSRLCRGGLEDAGEGADFRDGRLGRMEGWLVGGTALFDGGWLRMMRVRG
jgi:hypothetical protein